MNILIVNVASGRIRNILVVSAKKYRLPITFMWPCGQLITQVLRHAVGSFPCSMTQDSCASDDACKNF